MQPTGARTTVPQQYKRTRSLRLRQSTGEAKCFQVILRLFMAVNMMLDHDTTCASVGWVSPKALANDAILGDDREPARKNHRTSPTRLESMAVLHSHHRHRSAQTLACYLAPSWPPAPRLVP